jgi:type IV pilus assembly protein PilY1
MHYIVTLIAIRLNTRRMLLKNNNHRLTRTAGIIVAACCALLIQGISFAAWPNLPVAPLVLQAVGDPNIILTLDDSGSMSWDAVPDSKVGSGSRRRLAARWNPLAYNPFTVYELPYAPVADGTRLTTSFTAAPINGFDPAGGNEDLSTNYQTHWAYLSGPIANCFGSCTSYGNGKAAMDDRAGIFAVGPAFYYAFYNDLGPLNAIPAPGTNPNTFIRNTVAPVGCAGTADINTSNCYVRLTVTGAAHQANFAAWFSFYRTRHLLTVSGASLAFYDIPLNYRVTWQSINDCLGFNNAGCLGWDRTARLNRIRPFNDAAHRSLFFDWLYRVPHHYGTPLVQALESAGEFYTQTGIETPMANQPGLSLSGPGAAATNTCRPNYHVMMTDGLWNGGASGRGNVDATVATLPDGSSYTPLAPYSDVTDGTLADVAFHYWKTDLQPSLDNNVIAYIDPNRAAGNNKPWNDPATWQHMVNFNVGLGLTGFLSGPPGQPIWGGNTYAGSFPQLAAGVDAWPAATNGSTDTVSDLWHAAVNSRGQFFSADNPTSLRDAFKSIVARINAGQTTTGQVASSSRRVRSTSRSFDMSFDPQKWTGALRAFNINPDGTTGSLAWTTDNTFTTGTGRSIFTWDVGTQLGKSFNWSSFSVPEKLSYFNGSQDLFDYLAGDRTHETPTSTPLYRKRAQLLADVIGSDLAVSGKFDAGYSVLTGAAGTSYKAFVASRRSVAFFGSNDGMLHAFRENGNEAFAYVPSAVLPQLKSLSTEPFIHAARVDGPVSLSDVYLGGAWKSVLLGGLGGGGKSFFALDVTGVTTSASGTFSASNVLFELNDADIGYTFARPVIARQRNGEWVAFFANGYGGSSNTAVLFVKNLSTGVLTKINTGEGTLASPNGLSSPTVLATQIGKAEAVYAGDYRGNMWKFVQDAGGTWIIANSGSAMFTADRSNTRQPITAAPTLESHPAGGVMVLFGTGKYFETQDRSDTDVNTFYGLRDRGAVIGGRAALVAQIITIGNTATAPQRAVSNNQVDYATKAGWYLDVNSTQAAGPSGEKIVASAIILDDTVVFNTFIPSVQACTGFGSSYQMGVNAFYGGLSAPVFDDNGNGKTSDDLVSGKPVAGLAITGNGTLTSPIASLVGLQARGSSNFAAGVCGGLTQPPCPAPNLCQDGLIVKDGLCSKIACPSGNVMVNNTRCYVTSKRATWSELR